MSMSNAGKPTPPSSDHSPINSHTADQLESPAQFEDPTTVPDVPVAGDVPDLGNADTIAELSQWCNIQRKTVRQLRVQLGDLNGGSVATQQISDVDEIVRQCLRHLRGHGCGDEQIQQLFAAWRKRKPGPVNRLFELLEKVEEDLSWAGGWANKHRDGKQVQEYRPPLVTADRLTEAVEASGSTQDSMQAKPAKYIPTKKSGRQAPNTGKLKPPSKDATTAYRLHMLQGKSQSEIATQLASEWAGRWFKGQFRVGSNRWRNGSAPAGCCLNWGTGQRNPPRLWIPYRST